METDHQELLAKPMAKIQLEILDELMATDNLELLANPIARGHK